LCLNLVAPRNGVGSTIRTKIPQMLGWIKGDPSVNSISLDNGLMVMKIPKKYVDKEVTIHLADPFVNYADVKNDENYNFYASKIKLLKGRILEVVLELPFRFGVSRINDEGFGFKLDDPKPKNNTDTERVGVSNRNVTTNIKGGKGSGGRIQESVVEVGIIEEGVEENSFRSWSARDGVGDDGQGKTRILIPENPSLLPIWDLAGYESMAKWIDSSNHVVASKLRELDIKVDGNFISSIGSLSDMPGDVKRFIGREQIKSMNIKHHENEEVGGIEINLFNDLYFNQNLNRDGSILEIKPGHFVKKVKEHIDKSAEKIAWLGESIDEGDENLSDIDPEKSVLIDRIVSLSSIVRRMYDDEVENRKSLETSIETILPF